MPFFPFFRKTAERVTENNQENCLASKGKMVSLQANFFTTQLDFN